MRHKDYVHPDDQTQPTFEMTPGFKPFTKIYIRAGFLNNVAAKIGLSPKTQVFFSVNRLQFSFGTFSKIQQDNALAFTITYTLIFVNVPSSSNIPVHFFEAFRFLLVKSEWRGGEDS